MPSPVPIIFDTDLSVDVDDVGALCVANALADRDEAEILAVLHGTGLSHGVGAISVINHWFGRDGVPIGAYRGSIGDPKATPEAPFVMAWTNRGRGHYVERLLEDFAAPIHDSSEVPSSVAVGRRALATAADGSVVYVEIGHATNLLDLLRSPPDDVSPLRGDALIAQKVAKMVWMGGSYAINYRPEWNFAACGYTRGECGSYDDVAQVTYDALSEWPAQVPIHFLSFDAGARVRVGGVLKEGAFPDSPCRAAYMAFCGADGGGGALPDWCEKEGRNAWDLQAVVMAVRGLERFYTLHPGWNDIHADSGQNVWMASNPGEEAEATQWQADLPKEHIDAVHAAEHAATE